MNPEAPIEHIEAYRWLTLEMWGALAVLSIYLSHFISASLLSLGFPTLFQGIGVDIIYFVTGLAAGWAVWQPQWSARNFLGTRLLRILPAYYVSLLLIVGLINSTFLLASSGLIILAGHGLMLQGFHPDYRGAINGVYGVIGTIIWLSVVVVLIAPLLRSRWRGATLTTGFALYLGWRIAVFVFIPSIDEVERQFWASQLPGVLDLYLAGMVCAWGRYVWQKSQGSRAFPLIISIVAIVVGLGILGFGILQREGSATVLQWFIGWRLLVVGGLVIFTIGLFGLDQTPWFAQLFRYSGLETISRFRYGILLYHLPVILSFNNVVGGASTTNPWMLFGIMSGAVLLIAAGSYHLVEQRTFNINHIPLFQWRRSNSHEHARQD
jgi:peptidoglycan/LPS O-acetylase OafA/YrhL